MNNAECEILTSLKNINMNDVSAERLAEELSDIPDEALQNAFVLSQGLIETLYKSPNLPTSIIDIQVMISSLIAYEVTKRITA